MAEALRSVPEQPVAWRIEPGLVDYEEAVAFMERRVAAIRAGDADELVWLLEHPALYTAGTSAHDDLADLADHVLDSIHDLEALLDEIAGL